MKHYCHTISPASVRLPSLFQDAWQNRRLLYVFVWRDIKIRYKQTLLGAGWIIVQPLMTMAVFSLVFGRIAKVPAAGVPYPVFVLCGLLPWQFFSQGLVRASRCLVDERYMLTHIYVPRVILPASSVLAGLLDMAVATSVLIGVLYIYGIQLSFSVLLIIPLLLLSGVAALSIGLLLSTLNVRFRDIGHTIPFFAQIWFFLTPVAYPMTLVPQPLRLAFELNPMTAVAEGFRRALLGSTVGNSFSPLPGILMTAFLLGTALLYFQKSDRSYGDLV